MEAPLLDETVEGAVDYNGRPVGRSKFGGWRSASFIIGVEVAERFAYYGIASNLINFLTEELRLSTAAAAQNVNVWSGVAMMLPLLRAFFGRFLPRTVPHNRSSALYTLVPPLLYSLFFFYFTLPFLLN